MGGKFRTRDYHGIAELKTAVLPQFSRYYHGKTAVRKKRGWFYHGITMVITVFLGWLFRKKKNERFYHDNTTVLPW